MVSTSRCRSAASRISAKRMSGGLATSKRAARSSARKSARRASLCVSSSDERSMLRQRGIGVEGRGETSQRRAQMGRWRGEHEEPMRLRQVRLIGDDPEVGREDDAGQIAEEAKGQEKHAADERARRQRNMG